TTLRPYYFEEPNGTPHRLSHSDKTWRVVSYDLGHYYWRRKLDQERLRGLLGARRRDSTTGSSLEDAVDAAAVEELHTAQNVLRRFSTEMPSAAELLYA